MIYVNFTMAKTGGGRTFRDRLLSLDGLPPIEFWVHEEGLQAKSPTVSLRLFKNSPWEFAKQLSKTDYILHAADRIFPGISAKQAMMVRNACWYEWAQFEKWPLRSVPRVAAMGVVAHWSRLKAFERIFLTSAMKEKWGMPNDCVMPHWLTEKEVFRLGEVQASRKIKPRTFAVVGDIYAYKGLEDLVKLKPSSNVSEIHWIGDIVHKDYGDRWLLRVQHVWKEKFIFHGALPWEQTMLKLAEASVLLNLSHLETFGQTILEALAMGKVVISRRTHWVESWVKEYGFSPYVRFFDDIQEVENLLLENNVGRCGANPLMDGMQEKRWAQFFWDRSSLK